jgi:hypothetical protein
MIYALSRILPRKWRRIPEFLHSGPAETAVTGEIGNRPSAAFGEEFRTGDFGSCVPTIRAIADSRSQE